MKKLVFFAMVATVLTIINGCQKDELVSQLADEQPQAVVKPIVYFEEDYLVLKDLNLDKTNNDPLNIRPNYSSGFNVQDYCISKIDNELIVEILCYDDDPLLKDALIKTCRLWTENNLDCIELINGNEKILLKWDRVVTGKINFSFEINNSKEEIVAIPDINKKTWNYDNNVFVLQKYQQLIKLIASIASDFDYSFYRQLRKNGSFNNGEIRYLKLKNKKLFDGTIAPLNMLDPCSATYRSRIAYNFSRTQCCTEATNDVNFECSNEFCIGCCSTSCDWGGIFGDFLGFCWAIGSGCSGPV